MASFASTSSISQLFELAAAAESRCRELRAARPKNGVLKFFFQRNPRFGCTKLGTKPTTNNARRICCARFLRGSLASSCCFFLLLLLGCEMRIDLGIVNFWATQQKRHHGPTHGPTIWSETDHFLVSSSFQQQARRSTTFKNLKRN